MGALSLIADTHHGWRLGAMIRFASHFIIGLAVALVSISAFGKYGYEVLVSPWVIPGYTIGVAIVLGIHHIKWGARDEQHDDIDEFKGGEHGH